MISSWANLRKDRNNQLLPLIIYFIIGSSGTQRVFLNIYVLSTMFFLYYHFAYSIISSTHLLFEKAAPDNWIKKYTSWLFWGKNMIFSYSVRPQYRVIIKYHTYIYIYNYILHILYIIWTPSQSLKGHGRCGISWPLRTHLVPLSSWFFCCPAIQS